MASTPRVAPGTTYRSLLQGPKKYLGSYKADGAKWKVWCIQLEESGHIGFLHECCDGSRAAVYLRHTPFPVRP